MAIAGATAATYTLVASGAVTVNGLPAGYVAQGGRLWMPNNVVNPPNGWDTWSNANTYCTTATIQGQTGWRLPTAAELMALYNSGAMNGQGWQLAGTWSSDSSRARRPRGRQPGLRRLGLGRRRERPQRDVCPLGMSGVGKCWAHLPDKADP